MFKKFAESDCKCRYLNTYKKYNDLLNTKAEADVVAFLKERHSLQGFVKKIASYQQLKDEISLLRITVPLSMFCLDCHILNADLCSRAQKLKEKLVLFEVEENRMLNKGWVFIVLCLFFHYSGVRQKRLNLENNMYGGMLKFAYEPVSHPIDIDSREFLWGLVPHKRKINVHESW